MKERVKGGADVKTRGQQKVNQVKTTTNIDEILITTKGGLISYDYKKKEELFLALKI